VQNAIARNGDVELYYETFGSPTNPTLVLVNGLASQCINYDTRWCEMFAARGFQVVRFDNRDTGLSSKVKAGYIVTDMANDVCAVLDAVGVARAHVLGLSMGGMIVQRLAVDHPERLLTMTTVMSRTGEPGYGESTPEALALLTGKPARTRAEYVESQVAAHHVYGSKPEWLDESYLRARAGRHYDRCFNPAGVARQMQAIANDPPRADGLRSLAVPTLVMHGDRDTLIDKSGGRRTAELIPGARYVEIEGMGHDYPEALWPLWVDTWCDFVEQVSASR
jgi:pimeloyl-ACP methyl ester carboxylesterase